ncbi:MAG: cupredoxin domain-containing protein [Acidobacteria bacterium]|nr:cupredoxin domain-containing protein [Acidobacteriota bacterium]
MKKKSLCVAALSILCALVGTQARSVEETSTNSVPPVAEIRVTARKFDFSPQVITVQKGQTVKLVVTSTDVEHGFAIKELKIKERVEAKETKVITFKPEAAGRYRFYCSVYCGDGHEDMTGELVVTDGPVPATTASGAQTGGASNMQVTFDESAPGVVFVEANGEKIRIDTTAKTVAKVELPADSQPKPDEQVARAEEEQESKPKSEPYDYYLINVPTPKRVVKGSLNLRFTHRFSQPVRPVRQSAENLLGLDSFAVSSLGLSYGITDRLYVNAYRSPICQQGMCKTIEIGLGYHWLDEAGRSPVSLQTYASIEGNDNFTEEYTYNLQAMIGRSISKWGYAFFSPAVNFNANGQRRFNPRASDFFPPALVADQFNLGKHTASFGFGFSARIRPTVSLMFEYTPRVGFRQGRVFPNFAPGTFTVAGFTNVSEAEIGFGIEKRIGRHSFSLTFSNTQATTTARYNSSNLALSPKRFIIGFNLSRRFWK